jgi:hypothetical protein
MARRLTREEHMAVLLHTSLIKDFDDLPHHKLISLPYMRESTYEQKKSNNLQRRLRGLRVSLRNRGTLWEACFSEVACGRFFHDRPALRKAIMMARYLQKKNPDKVVAVVTDARNRFVRGRHYNGTMETDPPSDRQMRKLHRLAGRVVLATILPPDTPFGEVRSYETTVGSRAGGPKPGRPKTPPLNEPGYMKKRRKELLPKAFKLHQEGLSLRQIADLIPVARSTLGTWLSKPSGVLFLPD